MTTNESYLESVKKQFHYYKSIGEKAINQLDEHQLFVSENDDSNSIAVIIKHITGNMLSRWTDFLTTDGEKEWRDRDDEFEATFTYKEELLEHWEKGWSCLFEALNDIKPEQLEHIIYIRNEGHTVIEAINRQLSHYPYHIGQIVFYAKLLKKSDWIGLSIPKTHSKIYNAEKFSQQKVRKHFTDDELKNNN